MRKVLPLLLALLSACETGAPALEAPHILSISPMGQFANESQRVVVQLDTDPRFLVDYGNKSVQMIEQPMLEIGPQQVQLDTYLGHGQFEGTVPAGLEARRYDIRVTLGDGREATLPDAYEVLPEGEQPTDLSYWIESLGPQVRNRRFTVTLHVDGTNAERFRGSVTVKVVNQLDETLSSMPSGAFFNGVRAVELSVDTTGEKFFVVVHDDEGNRKATSNYFRVDPE